MKVYVVTQEWQSPNDGRETNIVGVFDSAEKASDKIKELYNEDVEWIKDHGIEDEEEFEENTLDPMYSFVQYEERWSCNEGIELEVQ